jgi:hypothetical protein
MKSLVLNASLTFLMVACPLAFASMPQSAAHDMKQAGHDVANATTRTGKTVGHAVNRTGEKVKGGADRVVHKGAKKTEKGASEVKNKTKI